MSSSFPLTHLCNILMNGKKPFLCECAHIKQPRHKYQRKSNAQSSCMTAVVNWQQQKGHPNKFNWCSEIYLERYIPVKSLLHTVLITQMSLLTLVTYNHTAVRLAQLETQLGKKERKRWGWESGSYRRKKSWIKGYARGRRILKMASYR